MTIDDGSVDVGPPVLCPSLAFEIIGCLRPDFFRPTLRGDFAVNFSKETRDGVDADRNIDSGEQFADKSQ